MSGLINGIAFISQDNNRSFLLSSNLKSVE